MMIKNKKENTGELDGLEVAEKLRVARIREFFKVTQHVPELAIVYYGPICGQMMPTIGQAVG